MAIDCSDRLADAMGSHGGACFRLGADFPGRDDGPCEPHVSLFMMSVEDHEVAKVAGAEPLRGGRLRELGPAGKRLADVVSDPDPEDLALFGMSPNGTCTARFGSWTRTGGRR